MCVWLILSDLHLTLSTIPWSWYKVRYFEVEIVFVSNAQKAPACLGDLITQYTHSKDRARAIQFRPCSVCFILCFRRHRESFSALDLDGSNSSVSLCTDGYVAQIELWEYMDWPSWTSLTAQLYHWQRIKDTCAFNSNEVVVVWFSVSLVDSVRWEGRFWPCSWFGRGGIAFRYVTIYIPREVLSFSWQELRNMYSVFLSTDIWMVRGRFNNKIASHPLYAVFQAKTHMMLL